MTDWRTRPRTGKSQFYPLMPEIQNRLALGETYRQIHYDLTSNNRIEIGYDQFARYIRNHLKPAKAEKPGPTTTVPTKEKPVDTAHPFFRAQTPQNGERRRNSDQDFHSSVPDREKIYGSDSIGDK